LSSSLSNVGQGEDTDIGQDHNNDIDPGPDLTPLITYR